MKQIVLICIAMVLACGSYGQDRERKFFLYTNGAFSQHKTNDMYPTTGYSSELKKGGKITAGIYGKVNDFIYAGIGLEYMKQHEYNDNMIDNFSSPSNSQAHFTYHTKYERSKIIPSINFKFLKNLTNRFSIGLNVLAGYEFTKTMDEYISFILVNYPESDPLFLVSNYNNTSNKQGVYFMIQPELIYYVSNWFGISSQVNFYTFDAVNASQFFFATNSNDIMWSFGLVFAI